MAGGAERWGSGGGGGVEVDATCGLGGLPERGMARAAQGKEADDAFYASKLGTARFYFARLLPRIHSLSASVKAGSESLYLLDEAQF